MNDHDAMEEINAVLDRRFDGHLTTDEALYEIATITGMNMNDHDEAKQAKP